MNPSPQNITQRTKYCEDLSEQSTVVTLEPLILHPHVVKTEQPINPEAHGVNTGSKVTQ